MCYNKDRGGDMSHIAIYSDLHLEFGGPKNLIIPNNVQFVLFIGDLHLGDKAIPWIEEFINNNYHLKKVFYILGNHEYYKQNFNLLLGKIKESSSHIEKLQILEKDVFISEEYNFRILGTTLFTDFNLFGEKNGFYMQECREKMSDFKKIRIGNNYRKITPFDLLDEHYKAKNWLINELEKNYNGKTIIASHFAPSIKSISDIHLNNPKHRDLSVYYASNLEDIILKYKPDAWFHAHIHEKIKYNIGNTIVATNPLGYYNEEPNYNFCSKFVYNIDQKSFSEEEADIALLENATSKKKKKLNF